jgi:hypothetical protein
MCDYSLHAVASRPAKIGDKLITTQFPNSFTRGLAAVTEPEVAVCLLPGTEVAFDQKVRYAHLLGWLRSRTTKEELARFRQVNMDNSHTHHDAFEFPSGQNCHGDTFGQEPKVDCASAPSYGARCK